MFAPSPQPRASHAAKMSSVNPRSICETIRVGRSLTTVVSTYVLDEFVESIDKLGHIVVEGEL
jgi:hypothetical protein